MTYSEAAGAHSARTTGNRPRLRTSGYGGEGDGSSFYKCLGRHNRTRNWPDEVPSRPATCHVNLLAVRGAGQIENYVKYPPRQKAASFNLDSVMASLAPAEAAYKKQKAEAAAKAESGGVVAKTASVKEKPEVVPAGSR